MVAFLGGLDPTTFSEAQHAAFIEAKTGAERLEKFATEAALPRFCSDCSAPFTVSAETRAALKTAGKRLPSFCDQCWKVRRPRLGWG